jgi:hypothetical protein
MSLMIRPIEQNDAESCGKIGYEAHKTISSAHGYPSEQPSEEFGIGLIRWLLENGFQIGWLANLMTIGPYQEPLTPFLPSLAY